VQTRVVRYVHIVLVELRMVEEIRVKIDDRQIVAVGDSLDCRQVVPFGLLVAGISVSAGIAKLVPKGIMCSASSSRHSPSCRRSP
jgi:hypothetical protein